LLRYERDQQILCRLLKPAHPAVVAGLTDSASCDGRTLPLHNPIILKKERLRAVIREVKPSFAVNSAIL
jgi:hypothetical protein